MDSPKGSIHVDADTGSVKMSGKGGSVAVLRSLRRVGNPRQWQSKTAARRRRPAGCRARSATGPSPEELAKLEDEADKLNVRAATAHTVLDTLRQQQAAAGYNLRGDIASAQERAQMYLAKGNARYSLRTLLTRKNILIWRKRKFPNSRNSSGTDSAFQMKKAGSRLRQRNRPAARIAYSFLLFQHVDILLFADLL